MPAGSISPHGPLSSDNQLCQAALGALGKPSRMLWTASFGGKIITDRKVSEISILSIVSLRRTKRGLPTQNIQQTANAWREASGFNLIAEFEKILNTGW